MTVNISDESKCTTPRSGIRDTFANFHKAGVVEVEVSDVDVNVDTNVAVDAADVAVDATDVDVDATDVDVDATDVDVAVELKLPLVACEYLQPSP